LLTPMLRTIFKRTYATLPNRRTFPTTTTSPTPSTHNDKQQLALPVTPQTGIVPGPDISLEQQTTTLPASEDQISETENAQLSQWAIPTNVQESFPKPGAKRPHLNINVNPYHGLWQFFRVIKYTNEERGGKTMRRRIDDYDSTGRGTFVRVAVEPRDQVRSISGRSWSAAELRRKSFHDLHTLWYLVLRERNLLATQRAELGRLLLPPSQQELIRERIRKCKKTHARIKLVMSERRRGYERAIASLPKGLGSWRKERWGKPDSASLSSPTIPTSQTPTQTAPESPPSQ